MSIRFGTDGWRAVIAKELTYDNVRRVAQAIADYMNAQPRKASLEQRGKRNTHNAIRIIVGYDNRFMSDVYAELVTEVLAANGIHISLVDKSAPTPRSHLLLR